MTLKRVFIKLLIFILFLQINQTRYSRTITKNLNKEKKEEKRQSNNASKTLHILALKLKKNSPNIVETYCRFMFGDFKECMAKFSDAEKEVNLSTLPQMHPNSVRPLKSIRMS